MLADPTQIRHVQPQLGLRQLQRAEKAKVPPMTNKSDPDAAFLEGLQQLADQFAALADQIDPPDESAMRLHDGHLDLWSGPSRAYTLQLPDRMVAVMDELRRRGDPIASRSELARHLLACAIRLVTDPDPEVERFLAARAGRLDKIEPHGTA